MTFAEFYPDFFIPHLTLWLAAIFLLGLLLGLLISRTASKGKIRALKERLEEYTSNVHKDVSTDAYVSAKSLGQRESIEDPIPSPPVSSEPLIDQLKGMQQKHVKKLQTLGIGTIAQLLAATENRSQKEVLADKLQLEDFVVNKWVRMAELLALPGMTPEVAEFLVFAGVNSTADLGAKNAESLHHKLQNLNDKEQRIETVPTRQNIEAWAAHISKV